MRNTSEGWSVFTQQKKTYQAFSKITAEWMIYVIHFYENRKLKRDIDQRGKLRITVFVDDP